jgi:hypothetical protein
MALKCGQLDHCCWFNGKVCKYLVENAAEGYRYSCGLKLKYGTWDRAMSSDEWMTDIKPLMEQIGYVGLKCNEWPPKGVKCNTCGINE